MIIIIAVIDKIIPKNFTVICLYFFRYLEIVSVDINTTRIYQIASINDAKQEINNLFSNSSSGFKT